VLARWRRIPGPPRDAIKARLLRIYRTLSDRFGPQGSRPGRTPFEVAIGVMLSPEAVSTNAVGAIAALRRERLLSARALDRVGELRLGRVLRSAGMDRATARRLKAFARWLVAEHGGRFDGLRRAPLASLRASLLSVPGLSAETADAILLHAAHRPVFVADAVVRRALARQGVLRAPAGYEAARRFLEAHLPSDPALFNEFQALLGVKGGSARGRNPRSKRRLRRKRR
jgi:endonuclease-3 related protein